MQPPLTFVEKIVATISVLVLSSIAWYTLFSIIPDGVKARDEAIKASGTVGLTTTGGGNVRTVRHDNHLFVAYVQGGIIHHPSCPCLGSAKVEGRGNVKP